MANPNHHPDCPRCNGQGFYLSHYGRGFYRDGSFGNNQYRDCTCYPDMMPDRLPAPFQPTGEP